jgi:hypothetical protein
MAFFHPANSNAACQSSITCLMNGFHLSGVAGAK